MNQNSQLVFIAPQDGAPKPITSQRALLRLDRRGVPTMNAQVPMIYPMIVKSRMNEHLAAAEKARALRSLPQRKSAVMALRQTISSLLVRISRRVSPPAPKPEQGSEHVLIRLAR